MNAISEQRQPDLPWYRGLSKYHWFVLLVCTMGWFFDCMDQQLFILARTPALTELLGKDAPPAVVSAYGNWATAVLMLGWATGGIFFGMLGDRWGRAKTMVLTIIVYAVFTGLSAISVSWPDFFLYRFLCGTGVGGEFAAAVSLVAEIMPSRSRPYALALLQALSAFGNMSAAGISFLLPPQQLVHGVAGWRLMFLVGIVPAILVVFVMRRLKEPESWVRAKEAEARGEVRHKGRGMGSLTELFGERRWRKNAIIGITLAVGGMLGLWAAGFWMPELVRNNALAHLDKESRDWYASMAMLLQNGGAFVGIYVFSILTGIIGRRWTFAISLVVGMTVVSSVFGFMMKPSQVWWMAPMVGFATLMVFGGYTIYFPELFPTRLRATGTAFCYNTTRYLTAAGLFLMPALQTVFIAPEGTERYAQGLSNLTILSSMGSADNAFRYAAIAVTGVYLVGLLALPFAPETKGKPLPE